MVFVFLISQFCGIWVDVQNEWVEICDGRKYNEKVDVWNEERQMYVQDVGCVQEKAIVFL